MQKISIPIIVFLVFLITSCAPVYVPPVAHTPLMKEKGDKQFAGHFSTSGTSLQFAYALTNHLAIKGTGSGNLGLNSSSNRHIYGDFGFGGFTGFLNNGVFELYTGLGAGRGQGHADWEIFGSSQERNTAASFLRPFLQTNLGLSLKHFDTGISAKALMLHIFDYTVNNVEYEGTIQDFYIEPSLFIRAGFQNVKISASTGFSIPVTEVENYSWIPWNFALGVHVYLGQ